MENFKNGTYKSARNVTHVDDVRILTCRVKYKSETVRIIASYGPQETDDLELRKDFYINLGIEIEKSACAGDGVMLVGDMNAKLKLNDEGKIVADSGNGKLLCEMIEDMGLQVINFSHLCNGKWTWEKEKQGIVHRSQIDYLMVDNQIMKSVM